jgi:hypothetical protein
VGQVRVLLVAQLLQQMVFLAVLVAMVFQVVVEVLLLEQGLQQTLVARVETV